MYLNIVSITTDLAPNMRLAVDLFDVPKLTFVSHKIHSTVSSALSLSSMDEILTKVTAMVTHFKHSTTAKAELNDLQKKDPDVIAILGLIQGLKTGWNSDHDMIVRFIKLKTKLVPVVMKHQNCPPMPSNLGVRLLDCEVTSSIVIPYKNNLFEEWEKMNYVNCEAMNASDNLIAEDMFEYLKT